MTKRRNKYFKLTTNNSTYQCEVRFWTFRDGSEWVETRYVRTSDRLTMVCEGHDAMEDCILGTSLTGYGPSGRMMRSSPVKGRKRSTKAEFERLWYGEGVTS